MKEWLLTKLYRLAEIYTLWHDARAYRDVQCDPTTGIVAIFYGKHIKAGEFVRYVAGATEDSPGYVTACEPGSWDIAGRAISSSDADGKVEVNVLNVTCCPIYK